MRALRTLRMTVTGGRGATITIRRPSCYSFLLYPKVRYSVPEWLTHNFHNSPRTPHIGHNAKSDVGAKYRYKSTTYPLLPLIPFTIR